MDGRIKSGHDVNGWRAALKGTPLLFPQAVKVNKGFKLPLAV
jgi:hypothetical protein